MGKSGSCFDGRSHAQSEQSSLYSRALSVSTLNTALCACGPQTSLAALGSTLTVGVPCFLTWGPSLTAVDARDHLSSVMPLSHGHGVKGLG